MKVRASGTGAFASDELENSIPFDANKRLRGDEAMALLEKVLELVSHWETITQPRQKALRPRDVEIRRTTVDAFLANIAGAAFNYVRPDAFAAIPYSTTAFSGLPLAPKVMRLVRDALLEGGLIEGQGGFQKHDLQPHSNRISRVTRLRATGDMREQLEGLRLRPSSVVRRLERQAVHVKSPQADLPPEPADVTASGQVIKDLNARLLESGPALPDGAWKRIRQSRVVEGPNDKEANNSFAGDMSATVLRRVFNRSWERGGRVYGGWWMHVPSSERQWITIDGLPTVELDYSRLHPTLLFSRAGVRLDFDPYVVPGLGGGHLRDLGKRTFGRLINKARPRPGLDVKLKGYEEDRAQLPKGLSFANYLKLFIQRLAPIAEWLGTEVGMELQREDSDLAIAVIKSLGDQGLLALPIHDSFIVQVSHEGELRKAMGEAFQSRYGFIPDIKKGLEVGQTDGAKRPAIAVHN